MSERSYYPKSVIVLVSPVWLIPIVAIMQKSNYTYKEIDHVSSYYCKMAPRTVKEWTSDFSVCPACNVPLV
jgi:hypothetical protein